MFLLIIYILLSRGEINQSWFGCIKFVVLNTTSENAKRTCLFIWNYNNFPYATHTEERLEEVSNKKYFDFQESNLVLI